jgi:hypothetical protein
MRRFLAIVLLLPLVMPCVGCGESRPDPREHPDFVDDTDPSLTPDPSADVGGPGGGKPGAAP